MSTFLPNRTSATPTPPHPLPRRPHKKGSKVKKGSKNPARRDDYPKNGYPKNGSRRNGSNTTTGECKSGQRGTYTGRERRSFSTRLPRSGPIPETRVPKPPRGLHIDEPLLSQYGTYKKVKAILLPWLSGESPPAMLWSDTRNPDPGSWIPERPRGSNSEQ